MNIIFFGTSEFAVPALRVIAESPHQLLAVVTTPDRPAGRGRKMTASHGKAEALRFNARVLQPEKLDKAFESKFRELGPDICVVASYGKIIPAGLLEIPERGMINIHPSLLPRYRGASPIQQPILNGDQETGVTIIKVTAEMDAGPIILQESLELQGNENAGELHDRLAGKGAQLMLKALKLIEEEKASFIEQDPEGLSFCAKIEKQDGCIDWSATSVKIDRRVRAMTPWPGAFTFQQKDGRRLKITAVEIIEKDFPEAEAGLVVLASDREGFVVACGSGAVGLTHLAPAGGRKMTSQEFMRGSRLQVGDRLGEKVDG